MGLISHPCRFILRKALLQSGAPGSCRTNFPTPGPSAAPVELSGRSRQIKEMRMGELSVSKLPPNPAGVPWRYLLCSRSPACVLAVVGWGWWVHAGGHGCHKVDSKSCLKSSFKSYWEKFLQLILTWENWGGGSECRDPHVRLASYRQPYAAWPYFYLSLLKPALLLFILRAGPLKWTICWI